MVLASDGGGMTGGTGGGGGMTGYSPTQKKKDDNFTSTVKGVAGQLPSGGTSPTSGGSKDPLVYMGSKYKPGTQEYYDMLRRGHSVDQTMRKSQAELGYQGFSTKEKDKFLSQLQLAGYDVSQMDDYKLSQVWSQYVGQAAAYYAAGKKLTPWDIMAKDMHQREYYSSQPKTVTQTQKSYDMSTRADAQSIFYTAAQQLLGRDPTKKEVSSFQSALNKYEQAHPSVTTTTSTYKGQDMTGQTSTTTGGVKESAREYMAMEKAKADPEYGAYQAATTYFDALTEAIGK